ncbi:MAG: hypothetical protein Q8S31_01585 [Alphaproteobacteria bacterium]|nr:hypothetical protein [Alphaproteobacteria bacterium]
MFTYRSIYIFCLGIALWCCQAIAAPAHVAVLGWGSLIWNPGGLNIYGQFVPGGPTLPVSFTRISQDGRLTLVVDPKSDSNQRKPSNVDYPGVDVQTHYLLIKDNNGLNFDEVIGVLRKREGTKSDYIDYVNRAARKFRINQISAFTGQQVTVKGTYSIDQNGQIDIDGGGVLRRELTPYLKSIIGWVHQMDLKGVVWTGIQRNFFAKTGQRYTLDNAKLYLKFLDPTQRAKALEYIQNAPVKTPHGNILLAYLKEIGGNLSPLNAGQNNVHSYLLENQNENPRNVILPNNNNRDINQNENRRNVIPPNNNRGINQNENRRNVIPSNNMGMNQNNFVGCVNNEYADLENPDLMDEKYRDLMRKYDILTGYTEISPEDLWRDIAFGQYNHIPFPCGKYGKQLPYGTFWQYKGDEHMQQNVRGQGWKLHVSATPDSAIKIAKLLLPILINERTMEANVAFKIMHEIPLLRTMNHVYGQVKGDESQAGKYLVIYNNTASDAYKMAKKIDSILVRAKRDGILKDSDFYKLIGDAEVGFSGGVFTRYGRFRPGQVKMLDPRDKTRIGVDYPYEADDRFYPWPDSMNKNAPEWRNEPSPFKELPLKWKLFKGQKYLNSWEDRPFSWN